MNPGRTKDEPKNSKIEKSTFIKNSPLLYLASFYRENTDRRPRDDRDNSDRTPRDQKVLFINICFPDRVTYFPKKVDSFSKKVVPFPEKLD